MATHICYPRAAGGTISYVLIYFSDFPFARGRSAHVQWPFTKGQASGSMTPFSSQCLCKSLQIGSLM